MDTKKDTTLFALTNFWIFLSLGLTFMLPGQKILQIILTIINLILSVYSIITFTKKEVNKININKYQIFILIVIAIISSFMLALQIF